MIVKDYQMKMHCEFIYFTMPKFCIQNHYYTEILYVIYS